MCRQRAGSRCHSSVAAAVQCADPVSGPHHTSPGNGTPSRRHRELLYASDNEWTASPTPTSINNNQMKKALRDANTVRWM